MTISAIRGFKDILPRDVPLWTRIEEEARKVAALYGFGELRTPVMERTSLFARGIGEATDIVEKEMYSFEDRGGESVSLRPEATAGVARAVLEHNLLRENRSKFFALGPMFRRERPQKGRLRQFHQLDVEAFGDPGPQIDAEVMDFLLTFLRGLGLSDPILSLNSLGCPECRPAFRKELAEYLLSREASLCPDCRRRLALNPLRVLDCKNPGCREVAAGAPKIVDRLCPACVLHFRGVMDSLAVLGRDFSLDPFLVRGLDYYSRTAFEVAHPGLGSQNAVAGGGRYDGLVAALGGPDTPAVGFAVGLERLALLLSEKAEKDPLPETPGPRFFLAVLCPEAVETALRLLGTLRKKNFSCECDWRPGSLRSRLKRADKLKAEKAIMLGERELALRLATVRDLSDGSQREVPLDAPAEDFL
ncbi:MAG: histidine--tRNA ligase [Deltaproteobacteria bacterium]|nr:histidine--tRNA ligase [Deltaproteobacteria bacterium]